MAAQTPESDRLREEFEALALPHLESVWRLARRLSGNHAEAEDLVQEVYLRALRSFDRFELRACGPKPWLLKILHNVFCTRRSQSRRQPMLMEEVDLERVAGEIEERPLERWPGENEVPWDEFDEVLARAVQSLRPEYRTVLLLWALEGLSYREIAHVCECPVGTVMSRLYRARQILCQRLGAWAGERNIRATRVES